MFTSVTEALQTIEKNAERALLRELKLMVNEVLTLRQTCCPDDRAFADGLLLKLDRLIGEQCVQSAHGELCIAGVTLPQEESALAEAANVEAVLT